MLLFITSHQYFHVWPYMCLFDYVGNFTEIIFRELFQLSLVTWRTSLAWTYIITTYQGPFLLHWGNWNHLCFCELCFTCTIVLFWYLSISWSGNWVIDFLTILLLLQNGGITCLGSWINGATVKSECGSVCWTFCNFSLSVTWIKGLIVGLVSMYDLLVICLSVYTYAHN